MKPEASTDLAGLLKKDAKINHEWAAGYDFATDLLSLIAVLSGFLISLLLALKTFDYAIIAVLSSAVPGAAVAVIRLLKLPERAQWHWTRSSKFFLLYSRLEHLSEPIHQIHKEYEILLINYPDFPSRSDMKLLNDLVRQSSPPKQPILVDEHDDVEPPLSGAQMPAKSPE